jgi:hypothetical protein
MKTITNLSPSERGMQRLSLSGKEWKSLKPASFQEVRDKKRHL